MRSFLKYAHRYMGYITGMVVAVVCITGGILVFEKEIISAINRDLYTVKVGDNSTPLKAEALLPPIDKLLGDNVEKLIVSNNPERSWAIAVKDSRDIVYVNQYNGKILGKAAARHPFFITTMKLHRFLLADKVGRVVVGISTIIFLLILVSGLAVWLPKRSGSIKKYFKTVWRKASFASSPNRYRKFYDWHVIPALLAFPFIFMMAITGPTWSFDWYKKGFYAAFGAEIPIRTGHGGRGGEKEAERGPKTLDFPKQGISKFEGIEEAIEAVKKVSADSKEYSVAIPARRGELQVSTTPHKPLTSRQTDKFTYSIKEHRIVKVEMWSDKSHSEKMSTFIYAFHTGTWGGIWSKAIYLLAVLAGGVLPITGFAMLVARKRRFGMSAGS